MMNGAELEILEARLSSFGQQHLLQFWPQLSPAERKELFDEILNLKLEEVTQFFKRTMSFSSTDQKKLDDRLQPVADDVYGSALRTNEDKLELYENIGLREIANGTVGVLLLAGGQGTRLGVSYPKGMYNVGLPSQKTLYQIQAERIRRLETLASEKFNGIKGNGIPWYIMTSEHTKEPTLDYFAKHNYFGLKRENLVVFEQGMLPCFTFDGKIILETKSKISKSPDGNGGLYRALREKKILDDVERRGIQYLHVYCVDNILVKMADPVFMGFAISKGADCAAKTVEKTFPEEAVGVVCKVDGKYRVVEYSEITLNTAKRRNDDGRLTFSAGNICNHFFTTEFLRNIIDNEENSLMHHVAKKKIPTVDENGKTFVPSAPNGIKMEKFVFDVFQCSKNFVVWDVVRDEEFSPLKNADGAAKDTPTTARHDLYTLHERFLRKAGAVFVNKDKSIIPPLLNGLNGTTNGQEANNNDIEKCGMKRPEVIVCEISPLVSYSGENLEHFVAGKTLCQPFTLRAPEE
ncbi:UDP-N-acetylhexosamine pyrophosphorylase [Neocloeon triangulifer]|uniref:UDP-N-acetylhexosamine pyrophosphorylase n=1 Tax=Neocloeon triangulifer TaxID=2078957 RepID=UPI00286EDC2F|nr:UDP-N-acetylhexosamine pyrophosphorylase [Neocloeon triangulifer]XP_059469142.1 UDP-N-acetylhexosamine pyrophosphorylase [Neocloeon triangulifer]XP_059469143.1 UDP-N-acetylhexosamine pyrophosphorylase [Neocloeon triangulifer]